MDFSAVGGVPVSAPAVPGEKKIDFSAVGGKPVAQAEPTMASQLRDNLLGNGKTDWSGRIVRSAPATIGAGIGATLAAGPSLALGPFAPAGVAAGAYVGGVAGEGVRNAAVGLNALYHGQEPPSAGQGIASIGEAGTDQALGHMAATTLTQSKPLIENVYKPAYEMAKNRLAGGIKMFSGIPEAMTKWAMKRGPKQILTATNAEPEMQQAALEGMRENLIGQKKAAGSLVGQAEDRFLASPAASNLFDASPVAGGIRAELKRPIFDSVVNEYGGAAAEKGALEKLAGDLESGPASGRQLLGMKQNIDRGLDWNGSPLPNPSTDLQRITKGVNHELRGTLSNADPAGIGKANPNYGQADDLYSAYQKPLGHNPNPSVENDKSTINRLRIAFGKGDAAEGVSKFDEAIARSRQSSLDVREGLSAPQEPPPAPQVSDRSNILARKMKEFEDARAAAALPQAPAPASPQPAPGIPSVPARTPIQPNLAPKSVPQKFKIDPLTGGGEPLRPDILERPTGRPLPEAPAGQPPADYRTPAERFIESRNPAPLPEPPLSPADRLRAAAARLKAEQARGAVAPAAPAKAPEIPWQNRPEGPGWLDKPQTTPARDFMDATTAAAFYAKSDPMRAPSSTMLRLLAAMGPATAARVGLKAAQTGVEAARATAPYAGSALQTAIANALKARRSKD